MNRKLTGILAAALALAAIGFLGAREIRATQRLKRLASRTFILPPIPSESSAPVSYAISARFSVPLEEPTGISAKSENTIYVCGDQAVLHLSLSGELLSRSELPDRPTCVAADATGRIYLGFERSLGVLNSRNGDFAPWADLDENAIVTSIALSEKWVYVADAGNRLVLQFDREGMLKGVINGNFIIPSPYFDVAVDPEGTLWVADTGRHTLVAYGESGSPTEKWGKSAMDVQGFSGCCNPSHFTITGDGRFITSEKGLQRIKEHDSGGRFVGLLAGTRWFKGVLEGLDLAATASGGIVCLLGTSREVVVFTREDP